MLKVWICIKRPTKQQAKTPQRNSARSLTTTWTAKGADQKSKASIQRPLTKKMKWNLHRVIRVEIIITGKNAKCCAGVEFKVGWLESTSKNLNLYCICNLNNRMLVLLNKLRLSQPTEAPTQNKKRTPKYWIIYLELSLKRPKWRSSMSKYYYITPNNTNSSKAEFRKKISTTLKKITNSFMRPRFLKSTK